MRNLIIAAALSVFSCAALAGWVCDTGWDKYGHWVTNLNCRQVEGPGNMGYSANIPLDKDRIGEVTSVRKGVDGSIYLKRYGQGTTEYRNIGGEWEPVGRW